jgi:RimJ/RimL family protein N-acetyltransferase
MDIQLAQLHPNHIDELFRVKNTPDVLETIPGDYPLDAGPFRLKCKGRIRTGANTQQSWFVVLVGGKIAGSVGHFQRGGVTEVGYYLGKPWWGRGLATQALLLFLDELVKLGFSGVLHASHAPANRASGRVLEKAGFVCKGEVPFVELDGTAVMDVSWAIALSP